MIESKHFSFHKFQIGKRLGQSQISQKINKIFQKEFH